MANLSARKQALFRAEASEVRFDLSNNIDVPRVGVQRMKTSYRTLDWDCHLVQQAQAGESAAFELILDQYRAAMISHAQKMLRNSEDAHDAVQEASLKAMRGIGSFEAGRPLLPWLLRIVGNCAVDCLRGRKKTPQCLENIEFAIFDDKVDLQSSVETAMEAAIIRRAVIRLPRQYREIIEMRHFEDLDVTEIASLLQKPEGTIKSWLFRARAMLRKELVTAA